MDQLTDYVRRAKECRDAAAEATSAALMEHYVSLAERWESLAREYAAQKGLQHILAQLQNDDDLSVPAESPANRVHR